MIVWKGFGRKRSLPNDSTALAFARIRCHEPRKTSVRMIGVPANIRTKHFPGTILERYRYAHRLGLRVIS
jgi:hypothetical protein